MLPNPWAEGYKHILTADQNIRQADDRKDFMSSKEEKFERFLPSLGNTDNKSTEEAIIQQKETNSILLGKKDSSGASCIRYSKNAIRKNFKVKPETQINKHSFQ